MRSPDRACACSLATICDRLDHVFPDSQLFKRKARCSKIWPTSRPEIASARTFVFVREIEPLLQMGLIKGGDLSNALVIYERAWSKSA